MAAATRREPDEDEPPRRRSGDRERGGFALAAKAMTATVAKVQGIARFSADAFGKAAQALAATLGREPWLPPEADYEAAPYEAVDAANPFWDCSLDSANFDGGAACSEALSPNL